jgi:hypothetical protein
MLADTITVSPCRDTSYTKPVAWRAPILPQQEFLLIDRSHNHLKRPVSVVAKLTEEGYWLVISPGIMAYGTGESPEEAAMDFYSMLLDLFSELSNSSENLAHHLELELEYLKTIVATQE